MSFKMVYLEWSTVIEKAEMNNVIACGVSYNIPSSSLDSSNMPYRGSCKVGM